MIGGLNTFNNMTMMNRMMTTAGNMPGTRDACASRILEYSPSQ